MDTLTADELKLNKKAMIKLLETKKAAGSMSECGMDVYEYIAGESTNNRIMLRTTDLAVNSWYEKKMWYDFKLGKPKVAKTDDKAMKEFKLAESNEFTQMMWKASTSVLFGIKGKYAVAWFCPKGNSPVGSQIAYVKNVSD
jgi:glutaredoxin 2